MIEIIGVKFKTALKISYFKKGVLNCDVGEYILCKTVNGIDLGKICYIGEIDCDKADQLSLKEDDDILRKANDLDFKKCKENLKLEEKALTIAKDCIKNQNLNMKILSVASSFDRSKVIFFFGSDERVDFRVLVRKLAFFLHTRVELRQIGIRDEAKIIGGIGVCGRRFCCSSFLKDFHHVSIKMAKDQSLSLNPKKISGCCGKLMCCLQYEKSSYDFFNKICPKIGDSVMSPDGEGVIISGNPLTGIYRVKLNKPNEYVEMTSNKDSLKIITKCKNKSSKKISE